MKKIAIVGTGNIAPLHVEGLLKFPERCKIVALCDIYPEKAEAMKARYDLDCDIYDDHLAMLEAHSELDVIHICTPPYVHAQIAINCMNRGKNVLVEKPMATCLAECDAMLEAERRNAVTMGIIAQNRFRNEIYKLKRTLDSGLAGKVICAHVQSLWWRGHCYYDLWWRGLWEKEGGGPTLNHAVHHIDMLNWMMGELPTEVFCMLTNTMHDNSEVEDLSLSVLRYRDNAVAEVTSSVVHHGEEQGIVLQCERAKLSAPWDENIKAEISRQNGFPTVEGDVELKAKLQSLYASLADLPYEAHSGEIDQFLTAVENGVRPMIDGEAGRRTVELITAMYKSGSTKSLVTLPIDSTDEFYTFDGLLRHAIRFYEKSAAIENFAREDITVGRYKDR